MAILVITAEGLSDTELRQLIRDLSDHDFVDDVLACTDEQARDVRRVIDW